MTDKTKVTHWVVRKQKTMRDGQTLFELLEAIDSDTFVFAARFRLLGITAYGKTEEEAVEKLGHMIASYITAQFSVLNWVD